VVRAVTVMVISCPCALGVAIPMARLAGISLAGRRGILVAKSRPSSGPMPSTHVVFDKTGTLTHGRWQLVGIECQPGYHPATIAAWAAGLEQSSDHEIARSIKAYARVQGISPARVTDVSVHPDGVGDGWKESRAHRQPGVRLGPGAIGGWSQEGIRSNTDIPRLSQRIDRPVATLIFGDTIRPTVPSMLET
jgi:cation transport ATPase